MAKYRQVHVSFWQDSFVLDLPTEEKFFYLYLMTNSKTTQCGIYELPIKVVEMETGLPGDRITELISKFVGYGRILYNEETQEVMLLNWLKHNSLRSIKVLTCAAKEIQSVKHIPYVNRFIELCNQYGYPIYTVSIDYPKGYKPSQHPYGEEQEEEREQEKEEEQEQTDVSVSQKILNLINQYNVMCKGTFQLDELSSYVGVMEFELVEHCIKLSENKSVAYCITILERLKGEGKTTLAQATAKATRNNGGENVIDMLQKRYREEVEREASGHY